jgi:membrane protein YqaA with SNARE-associated domain
MMINSEAIAVALGLQGGSPLVIALTLAFGQTTGFYLIYLSGEWVTERSPRLKRLLESFDLKYVEARVSLWIGLASIFGLPPLNVSCLALSALKVRLTPLIPLIFAGRFLRYLVVASIPAYFAEYVSLDWIRDWLTLPNESP